ncbi:MAG: B12-binding domain-containing radical SAM protein, partial [Proteobacteria bacterium]|nr:B12-binding domain-containing radical SAM protein [Pseudomonadota bacterium]
MGLSPRFKIALVSPFPDISNFGLRTLSALLRQEGYATQMLFLPDYSGEGQLAAGSLPRERYAPRVVEAFLALIGDAQLVGFSVMTHYFDAARQLSEAVRQRYPDKKVIWGGFHPSARPGECLEYADFVAQGDGEELLLELCASLVVGALDLHHVPALWWWRG